MGKKEDNEKKQIVMTIVDSYTKQNGTKVPKHIRIIKKP